MKSLVLHCEACDRVQLFRGAGVNEIMSLIDDAGWRDQPDVDGKYGKGHAPALCPVCLAKPDEPVEWHSDTDESHAAPGQFCPTCGDAHCSDPKGHKYNDNDYCVYCGADGRA